MEGVAGSRNLRDQISEFELTVHNVLERRGSFQEWMNDVTTSPTSPVSRQTPSPNAISITQPSAGIDEELERLLAEDPGLVMDDTDGAKASKVNSQTSNLSLPNVVVNYTGSRYDDHKKFYSSAYEIAEAEARLTENRFYDIFQPKIVEAVQSSLILNTKPPTFKHVTPTSRTNARQLLLREKCLQEEQQQRQRQQRWRQDAASIKTQTVVASATTTTSSLTPTPAISIKRPSEEALNSSKIPAEVLKVQSRLENPTKYHMIESQRRQISQFLNGNDKSDDPIPGTSASSFLALPRQNVHPRSAPEHSDPPKRSKHEFVTNSFPDDLGFCSTSAPCPAIISTQTSTIPGNSAAVDGGAVAAANDANANAIVKQQQQQQQQGTVRKQHHRRRSTQHK